ncbi:membrane protein EE42 [Proboscivirus elephantidbeta5]|uniref:Membrane protein EE42 n=1 Tax=Elephant endotheliotropic herpesvirus 5 TaxID=768738 RepID=A0A075CYD2_9BETA|nr:membrane protein EE42 [Elephant endotheliotropic herpesvirus 5]AHC02805.1 membrane protein EE42 [Elephant endotheliotropic herpesvirus 5]
MDSTEQSPVASPMPYLLSLGEDSEFYEYVLSLAFVTLFLLCCVLHRINPAPKVSFLDPILISVCTILSLYYLLHEQLFSLNSADRQPWPHYFLETWMFYCYTVCALTMILYIIYHLVTPFHQYEMISKVIRRLGRRTFIYITAMLWSIDVPDMCVHVVDETTTVYVFVYLYIFVLLTNALSELADNFCRHVIDRSVTNAVMFGAFLIVHINCCSINSGMRLNGNVFTFILTAYGLSNQIV